MAIQVTAQEVQAIERMAQDVERLTTAQDMLRAPVDMSLPEATRAVEAAARQQHAQTVVDCIWALLTDIEADLNPVGLRQLLQAAWPLTSQELVIQGVPAPSADRVMAALTTYGGPEGLLYQALPSLQRHKTEMLDYLTWPPPDMRFDCKQGPPSMQFDCNQAPCIVSAIVLVASAIATMISGDTPATLGLRHIMTGPVAGWVANC